ncbi:Rv3654c family TadE-like protein [Streptomyces tsukubensis]|nr:Rv3654c family TadE-like protein [Streptomyces tsukubensis]QFR94883.1 hypothetical protein GBW32_19895 [Streptomyces tsukubensis]
MAVVGIVFAAALGMGQAVVAKHRAGAAADMGALAAAGRWADGAEEACAGARRVAEAQGGRIARCAVRGEVSDVTAVVEFGPWAARVRARAGPPGAAP